MFKWCELVYYNSPIIVNGIRKMVNYPITDLVYETQSDKIKELTKSFLEKDLNIKSHLINAGLDYYIYGNSCKSVFFPFTRFLKCKACDYKVNIESIEYKMKRGNFIIPCPQCKRDSRAVIEDVTLDDLSQVKIISWNPYAIDITENPITGASGYYYTLPVEIRNGIMLGSPNIVNTLPSIFIDAVKQNKKVQFQGNIYHLKTPHLSGGTGGWGISPLVPTLKLYLHIAILRKSTEAIGMEHIVPQRILFPDSRTSDPTVGSSMLKWREQIEKALKMWRRDPNYVMIAPYPTGMVNIGSQGRALIPTAEIKQAEEDMLRALDIPPEFIMGTTNLNNSQVALRMLDNQLTPYMDQITHYVNWIVDMVNAKYNKKLCHVSFTPFKLADDMMKIQLMANMTGTAVAKSTLQEALGIDPDKEREKIIKDSLDQVKDQKEVERKTTEMQKDISTQAIDEENEAATGKISPYNQQKMIALAQNQAQQMQGMPLEQRQSAMAQLQNEDYVMWSIVRAQLDTMKTSSGMSGGPQGMSGGPQQ
jgi:hypothetical protein